jgi:hypothetical protein
MHNIGTADSVTPERADVSPAICVIPGVPLKRSSKTLMKL